MLLLAVVLVFQCLMMGQVLLGFPLNKFSMLNNRNALSARFVMITVKSVFHLCDSSRNLLLACWNTRSILSYRHWVSSRFVVIITEQLDNIWSENTEERQKY